VFGKKVKKNRGNYIALRRALGLLRTSNFQLDHFPPATKFHCANALGAEKQQCLTRLKISQTFSRPPPLSGRFANHQESRGSRRSLAF